MKNKGFTLIELLAVIVILAIIAVIAVPRILNVVEDSKKSSAKASALGYIDAIEKQIMVEKVKNINNIKDGEYDDVVDFDETNNIVVKGNLPTAGEITISKGKVTDATICISGYTVSYDGSKASASSKCSTSIPASPDSILGKIANTTFTNNTVVNITAHGKTYSARVYNIEGNTTLSGENVYGTADDVATADREAVNMVILKVNGDLTINSGATVRPYYTEYGGPKGFVIYVTGKLTNNGTIDNSHGAKATGEDVYLWKNRNKTYETVPAVGAAGGGAVGESANGVTGDSGINRSTGGGGSGAAGRISGLISQSPNRLSGAGGAGTSYSGGSGGATLFSDTVCVLESASNIGGEGGSTIGTVYNNASQECTCTESGWSVVGGAGNPGGTGVYNRSLNHSYDGANGTGGLLVIYANDIDNKATISADGTTNKSTATVSSSGSGGGSINIFYYSSYSSTGTVSANGGLHGTNYYSSHNIAGNGGNGSITIGSIKTGSFVKNN